MIKTRCYPADAVHLLKNAEQGDCGDNQVKVVFEKGACVDAETALRFYEWATKFAEKMDPPEITQCTNAAGEAQRGLAAMTSMCVPTEYQAASSGQRPAMLAQHMGMLV